MSPQIYDGQEDTLRSQTISTQLQQIAQQAADYPDTVFTTLAHKMDISFLREAYRRTKKTGAPGVDNMTAKEYAVDLEANLTDLHKRLKEGYKAPPVKRVWMKKENGKERPIGMPGLGVMGARILSELFRGRTDSKGF